MCILIRMSQINFYDHMTTPHVLLSYEPENQLEMERFDCIFDIILVLFLCEHFDVTSNP